VYNLKKNNSLSLFIGIDKKNPSEISIHSDSIAKRLIVTL
jgi:hypothetical protein